MRSDSGFSLIEALVALTILAFASIALLRAGEAHIVRIGDLEARAIAGWVAENRLAEIALAPDRGDTLARDVDMLGRSWRIEQALEPTDDPELARVTLQVHEAGGRGAVARLVGFADLGSRR
jgi:general secretion pathway protein I